MKKGIEQLEELLSNLEIREFSALLKETIHLYSAGERQKILVSVVNHYSAPNFDPSYLGVFDVIIGHGLDLNFTIDHLPKTFLGLVVLRAPFKPIFDYFLNKGANINFSGEYNAFEKNAPTSEKELVDPTQFETCLDVAETKLGDKFTVDFHNFHCPKRLIKERWHEISKSDATIEISKSDYTFMQEQVEFLHDMVNTELLKDHIKQLGGKTYEEITNQIQP